MNLNELLQQSTKKDTEEWVSMVVNAVKFTDEELLKLLTKLLAHLDSSVCLFYTNEEVYVDSFWLSVGDSLCLNIKNIADQQISRKYYLTCYEHLWEVEDIFGISFSWLWKDADSETKWRIRPQLKCKISSTEFEDRPYIQDFIRQVVDYRLEHQHEKIDYDAFILEFVAKYRGKQKVIERQENI